LGGPADRRTDGPMDPVAAEPRRPRSGFLVVVLIGTALVLGGVALEIAR
jgi:hypothetical protein